MLSYCLKCKKILRVLIQELSKCAICGSKNQNLLKSKKQKDY